MGESIPIGKGYYLKGDARNWFWPTAAILLIMLQLDSFTMGLFMHEKMERSTYTIFSILISCLYAGSWIMILLAYGRNNIVKRFKSCFIVLASLQIPYAIGIYLSMSRLGLRGYYYVDFYGVMSKFHMIVAILISILWAFFMAQIVFAKEYSRVLRIFSAILLASSLFHVFILLRGNHMDSIVERYGEDMSLFISFLEEVVNKFIHYVPYLFFFGAMSFSSPEEEEEPEGCMCGDTVIEEEA